MKNIYNQIFEHLSDKHFPVIATVVRTRGSAPQVPGSSALFDDKGLVGGTIGGGAVEKRIQEIAAERFSSRRSGYFHFNLKNDISRKEEAICGGQITILVDSDAAKHAGTFGEMKRSLMAKEPGILLTLVSLENETDASIERHWVTNSTTPFITAKFRNQVESVVKEMLLVADPSAYCEIDLTADAEESQYLFLEPVLPPQKLVIAGAGHIGKALAHLGRLIGFDVTVIDDRPEYASFENIPDADHIIVEDVTKAMRALPKTRDTFVVIVTRGHKDDAEALKCCLGTDLAYLGMIGSRNKILAMREDFILRGWATAEQWASLYSPVGIEISSRTVEEIAISIAAQLIQVKNSRKEKIKGCPA